MSERDAWPLSATPLSSRPVGPFSTDQRVALALAATRSGRKPVAVGGQQ
jgi:hypothetical protein